MLTEFGQATDSDFRRTTTDQMQQRRWFVPVQGRSKVCVQRARDGVVCRGCRQQLHQTEGADHVQRLKVFRFLSRERWRRNKYRGQSMLGREGEGAAAHSGDVYGELEGSDQDRVDVEEEDDGDGDLGVLQAEVAEGGLDDDRLLRLIVPGAAEVDDEDDALR